MISSPHLFHSTLSSYATAHSLDDLLCRNELWNLDCMALEEYLHDKRRGLLPPTCLAGYVVLQRWHSDRTRAQKRLALVTRMSRSHGSKGLIVCIDTHIAGALFDSGSVSL